MHAPKLAAIALGGLLTAIVVYGASAAPPVEAASPTIGFHGPALETVQYYRHGHGDYGHRRYWGRSYWGHEYRGRRYGRRY